MDIKETLEKLRVFEGLGSNQDPRVKASIMRNKAEDLGFDCLAISGANGTVTLSIYIDNNKPLYITVYNEDKPIKFDYNGFRGTLEDLLKFESVLEIAKAL